MALNGIDIASYQEGLVPSDMLTTKFIVVKATGGKGYRNPCFREHADATLKARKLLGIYHFARDYGCEGTAAQEADHFIAAVKPYIGKATLWLDWEMDAVDLGPAWAKAWLDRVYAKTGVKPGIYMSKSVCNEYNWTSVFMAGYPLWVAQYPNYNKTGFQANPWTDASGFGAWGKPLMFQYTSSGRVTGWNADLDLDLFYGNSADWGKLTMVAGKVSQAVAKVKAAVSNAKVSKGGTYMAIANGGVNVRQKASVSSKKMGVLKEYEVVQIANAKKDKYGNVWATITVGKYKGCYVATRYAGAALLVKVGTKSINVVANEVIDGKWGNGNARIDALKKRGYNPRIVQKRVNEILRG